MNNKAVRVPSYATYQCVNGTMRIVVELTARLGDQNKCAKDNSDCADHVSDINTLVYQQKKYINSGCP